jgi:hypothetical protein
VYAPGHAVFLQLGRSRLNPNQPYLLRHRQKIAREGGRLLQVRLSREGKRALEYLQREHGDQRKAVETALFEAANRLEQQREHR